MADVFISYSKKDRQAIQPVLDAFANAGLSVWFDGKIDVADVWDRRIERELDAAAAVVVLWTPNSRASDFVRSESRWALDHGKLIQVILEPCRLPIGFDVHQYADLSAWTGDVSDDVWRRLVAAIWRKVGAHQAADGTSGPTPEPSEAAPAPSRQAPLKTVQKTMASTSQPFAPKAGDERSAPRTKFLSMPMLLVGGLVLAAGVAIGVGIRGGDKGPDPEAVRQTAESGTPPAVRTEPPVEETEPASTVRVQPVAKPAPKKEEPKPEEESPVKKAADLSPKLQLALATVTSTCSKRAFFDCYEAALKKLNGSYSQTALLFESGCESGNALSCAYLGGQYHYGLGVSVDHGTAAKFYTKACNGNIARGCTNLGLLYRRGLGVPMDLKRGADLLKTGCDGGDTDGCFSLSWLYAFGVGVPKNETQTTEIYKKACDQGVALGCRYLAGEYEYGDPDKQKLSKELFIRAANLSERDCDDGEPLGCAIAGYLYLHGRGVTKNLERAALLYRRACDGDYAYGCSALGGLYESGAGVSMSKRRASELKERAVLLDQQGCDIGEPKSCSSLATSYQHGWGVTVDPELAALVRKRGCDLGHADSCWYLGNSYGRGEGVPKDLKQAKVFFEKACKLGYDNGCERAKNL